MQFKAIIVAAFASSVAAQVPSVDPNLLNSVSSALGASAFNSILQNLPAELSSAKAGQIPSWVSQLPPALQSQLASQFGISFSAPVTGSGSASASASASSASASASSAASASGSSASASKSSMMASMTGSHSGSATGSMASGTGSSASPTSSSGAAPTGLIGAGLAGAAGLIGLLAL